MKAKDSVSSPSTRRNDLDWLRTLAVLLVLPFHSLLVFVQNPNSVVFMKDTIDCFNCDRVAGFIDQWHMPVLFIIAGMSTAFALAKRSGGQYLRERVSRLVIPLAVRDCHLCAPHDLYHPNRPGQNAYLLAALRQLLHVWPGYHRPPGNLHSSAPVVHSLPGRLFPGCDCRCSSCSGARAARASCGGWPGSSRNPWRSSCWDSWWLWRGGPRF